MIVFQLLNYNVIGGKLNRGLALVHSYKVYCQKPNDENLYLIYVVGWCIELVSSSNRNIYLVNSY